MDYLTYPNNINKQSYTSGMDSFEYRNDFKTAITYPYPIYYSFNSRGFRGEEWPTDLSNVVWCIGDSFTSGVGVPFEHTWPSILQVNTGIPCINLGIDGAPNRLIANIAKQVIKDYAPKYMAIMWSFPHRRYEAPWNFIHFSNASLSEDLVDFRDCVNEVNNLLPNIYNTTIPRLSLPVIENLNVDIHDYPLLDVGRDNYHFDYLTAEVVVESIVKHFNIERKLNEKN